MPEPTPTVIDSDYALADKWFHCINCSSTAQHYGRKADMAADIAAAREAWGVSREAVAGLVEAATKLAQTFDDDYDAGSYMERDQGERVERLRAALARVKEAQG